MEKADQINCMARNIVDIMNIKNENENSLTWRPADDGGATTAAVVEEKGFKKRFGVLKVDGGISIKCPGKW